MAAFPLAGYSRRSLGRGIPGGRPIWVGLAPAEVSEGRLRAELPDGGGKNVRGVREKLPTRLSFIPSIFTGHFDKMLHACIEQSASA
jgi:hypothetical protein